MKIFEVLLVSILLASCGPFVEVQDMAQLTIADKKSAMSLPIYNENQLRPDAYVILNIVEGISCKNMTWDPPATKIDAINQTKFWAYELGASAVLNLQCDAPRGTSTTYNCWESITCTAQAIKIIDK